MADFPTNIKTFVTHNNGDVINPDYDNEQQAEIVALQTKVGVDGSAVTTTHDYKLGEITSTDKAVGKTATQTLINKTLESPVVNVGSDATGDMYYRNAGVLTRIPVGTDNQIMKLNGTTPNWEAETVTVDASATVKGVVEIATAAEITAGTATGGTGAVLAITPDALAASTPVFNGSGLTNITASHVSTVTNLSVSTATNTDTTITTGFQPVGITVYYKLSGRDSAGSQYFTIGSMTYSGTTIKGVHNYIVNSLSGNITTTTITINTTAPKAGTNSGSGNSIEGTLTVNSTSSTNYVVRFATAIFGSPSPATADFYCVAWK